MAYVPWRIALAAAVFTARGPSSLHMGSCQRGMFSVRQNCAVHITMVLLHCISIGFFHIVAILHHLNLGNKATLYLSKDPFEVSCIRALLFLSEHAAGCFLGFGQDISRFIGRSITQNFMAV